MHGSPTCAESFLRMGEELNGFNVLRPGVFLICLLLKTSLYHFGGGFNGGGRAVLG